MLIEHLLCVHMLSGQPVPACEINVIIIIFTGEKQELRGHMPTGDIV